MAGKIFFFDQITIGDLSPPPVAKKFSVSLPFYESKKIFRNY
jgi:hypothetical protein